jgi:type II secretory pathway pseudopilin PulG
MEISKKEEKQMIERKEKQKQKLKERGITLIALVITIILLLILAGVALSTLTGDSGILNNAESAKEKTNLANAEEQVALAVQGALVQGASQGNIEITYSNLDKELQKITDTYSIDGAEEGPWIVSIDEYAVEINKKGIDKIILANKNGTRPWLPTGFSQVVGTSLDTGLTIANTSDGTPGTQNYVWIEVPRKINADVIRDGNSTTITLADAQDVTEISEILEAYAGKGSTTNYRGDFNENKDSWCNRLSMTEDEYNQAYNKMRNSIQKYGGFWLAQYEAGIAYEKDGEDPTNRVGYSEITKANYAKDQYPYNFVSCDQAQKIASQDSTEEYTSSLPFGIQWDLVCKFLEVKTNLEYADIAATSTWGNYKNIGWKSSGNSKWSEDEGKSFTKGSKEKNSESYLLTTGAIEEVKINATEYMAATPMNIYDFAGNVWEWTLEHATNVNDWRHHIYRGGSFEDNNKHHANRRDNWNWNRKLPRRFSKCIVLINSRVYRNNIKRVILIWLF